MASSMTVIYAQEHLPPDLSRTPSIFLLGPTPRSGQSTWRPRLPVRSWRPIALAILARRQFAGYVLVPEMRPNAQGITTFNGDYLGQVEWEREALAASTAILGYVPRSKRLPGFTTNVEWGEWKDSSKIVLGLPPRSQHNNYLRYQATALGVPVTDTLDNTVLATLRLMGQLNEPSCAFCQIVRHDEHHQVLWRGRDSVIIEPHRPVTPGHLLVIPRIHVHGAMSHPAISARAQYDAMTYIRDQGITDLNVIANVGGAATQTVFHLHLHLVPRRRGDNLHLPWTGQA